MSMIRNSYRRLQLCNSYYYVVCTSAFIALRHNHSDRYKCRVRMFMCLVDGCITRYEHQWAASSLLASFIKRRISKGSTHSITFSMLMEFTLSTTYIQFLIRSHNYTFTPLISETFFSVISTLYCFHGHFHIRWLSSWTI